MTSAPHHFLPEIAPQSIVKAREALIKSDPYLQAGKGAPDWD